MFGTRVVNHASWTNGKRTVTGCWEYSNTCGIYDVWVDRSGPNFGKEPFHVIIDDEDADSPEWGVWKLVKPKPSVDTEDEPAITVA